MKHSELAENRLAALTAIGAAGFAAVCGVSGFLMAEAMNRREPKLSREVAQTLRKNVVPPRYGAGIYEAQEHLRNAPHEMVTTEGYDHAMLVGHWFPCAEPKWCSPQESCTIPCESKISDMAVPNSGMH